MLQAERNTKILELLSEKDIITLKEVAELTKVSIDTARRDIDKLHTQKKIKKVRGGAVCLDFDENIQNIEFRASVFKNEKSEMSKMLSEFCKDGDAIGLSFGTTCTEVAHFLSENNTQLSIVTCNLDAVSVFSEKANFNIIIPEGQVDFSENSIYGSTCANSILKYNLDIAIISPSTISIEHGMCDFRHKHQDVMQAMIKSAKKVIVLANHQKFDKVSPLKICELDEVDIIITDCQLPITLKQKYISSGINLIATP